MQLFLCNHFWWCNNFCATNIPKRNILKLRSIISELWASAPPSGNAWKAILTLLGTHLPFPKIRLFVIDYTAKAALKKFITHILAETIIFSKIKSTLFIKSIFITRTTNWNFPTVSRIIIQTCISTNILIQIVFTLEGQNNLIIFAKIDESFWILTIFLHRLQKYLRKLDSTVGAMIDPIVRASLHELCSSPSCSIPSTWPVSCAITKAELKPSSLHSVWESSGLHMPWTGANLKICYDSELMNHINDSLFLPSWSKCFSSQINWMILIWFPSCWTVSLNES